MAIAEPSVGDAESCSWAPSVQRGRSTSVCFHIFPGDLVLPDIFQHIPFLFMFARISLYLIRKKKPNPTIENNKSNCTFILCRWILETVGEWMKRACNIANCKQHILITKTRELSVQKDSCNKLEIISEILRNSRIQQEKSQESKFKRRSLPIFLSHCFSDLDPPGTEDGKEIWWFGYDLLEMRYAHLENHSRGKKKKTGALNQSLTSAIKSQSWLLEVQQAITWAVERVSALCTSFPSTFRAIHWVLFKNITILTNDW